MNLKEYLTAKCPLGCPPGICDKDGPCVLGPVERKVPPRIKKLKALIDDLVAAVRQHEAERRVSAAKDDYYAAEARKDVEKLRKKIDKAIDRL